ncbi:YIP1 family protein [Primorskyibacter sedentarius]|uniref:YIP1 family protein n=1 Tax=Primorskyibacter sedentarius TaxID=745311 RepID=UPI003EBBDF5A
MAVTQDIVATYRGPGRVMRRLLSMGQREDRALALVMAGCAVIFVAQLPRLAREAHLTGQELNPLLGGSLLAWVFIAPLMLYALAAASHLVARLIGGRGDWYGARLALFWAILASSPLMLLNGLVAGFLGTGPALSFVGLLWLGVFCWFWARSLWVAERPEAAEGDVA